MNIRVSMTESTFLVLRRCSWAYVSVMSPCRWTLEIVCQQHTLIRETLVFVQHHISIIQKTLKTFSRVSIMYASAMQLYSRQLLEPSLNF
ncbi:hypothetical protein EB796_020641 [Bugula neritina]|uniref:Uncharacterized protein n=1 Tax=Bugula neritina TaxID=10212 RepID=A0A7J7J5K4_BUGNE|nr:hypothetical protein EB796_020641 [Bugula neritina]